LGGVACCTREAITPCEAAGFDFIVAKMDGAGQSETAVSDMVDHISII
jgi:LAO/AO transport system kinase